MPRPEPHRSAPTTPTAPTAPRRPSRRPAALPAALVLAILAALALAGCGGSSHGSANTSTVGSGAFAGSAGGQAVAGAPADASSAQQSKGVASGPAQPLQQRAMVRTATMAVTVRDVDRAATSALAAAVAAGGRADGDDRSDSSTGRRAELVLRVPPDRLDSLIGTVSRLGHEQSRTVHGQDVTSAQADVTARVKALTISVGRLQDFLRHSGSIGDLVALESQLTQRESELQSTVAQQSALAEQVGLASLTLDLSTPAVSQAGSGPAGFGAALVHAVRGLLLSLRWAAAVLGYLLPFLLALAVPAVPAVLWWRRRAGRPGLAPPPEPATE